MNAMETMNAMEKIETELSEQVRCIVTMDLLESIRVHSLLNSSVESSNQIPYPWVIRHMLEESEGIVSDNSFLIDSYLTP